MSKDSSSAHIKKGMLAAGSSILGHYGQDMRRSTLHNETGNVEIYRVSEETRKKGSLSFSTFSITSITTLSIISASRNIKNKSTKG